MPALTAIVEQDRETGLFVGHVPGMPGAHSQGETLDELRHNLQEVLELLFDEDLPLMESDFIGTQQLVLS
ncbi:MAG: type II toxin-antitoxin system HicB family antitoxin [SAR324 cluster bacterium]|nr:type II toxin-antitoxin system HicB family antitoxin [SAR324 cluster bacterium]